VDSKGEETPMSGDLEAFLTRVPGFSSMPATDQNEVLAYYLQSNLKKAVRVADIDVLRSRLMIPKYNTANQFSINCRCSKGQRPRFVKAEKGYSLERGVFEEFQKKYGQRPTAAIIKSDLIKHLGALTDPQVKEYLTEAINCFDSGYFRASVVLAWCVGYAILRAWLFTNHVGALNAIMTSWKIPKKLSKIEDFDELSERVVLDTAKTASVVMKEQHKQLVALLDQRNSFAHPSGRKMSAPIAEAYLIQIIDEVIVTFR
jgi:hypothetical protein